MPEIKFPAELKIIGPLFSKNPQGLPRDIGFSGFPQKSKRASKKIPLAHLTLSLQLSR